jgi:hypothetical protein
MSRFIDWRGFLGGMALATLGGLGIRALSGLPFWGCFLIALFGILVNGWLATWEDEQPGGFNNPTNQPPSSE